MTLRPLPPRGCELIPLPANPAASVDVRTPKDGHKLGRGATMAAVRLARDTGEREVARIVCGIALGVLAVALWPTALAGMPFEAVGFGEALAATGSCLAFIAGARLAIAGLEAIAGRRVERLRGTRN
jgi:hypothetical protein